MVKTPSTMIPLGTQAPDFSLPNTIDNATLSLQETKGNKGTAIIFICNHCPYVILIIDKLAALAAEYKTKGINFVAISSNDIENYPQDDPQHMKAFAREHAFSFPYLYDESQTVAKAYKAACTPDLYLFNNELACTYRGRFDAATPGNDIEVTGNDFKAALDAMLEGNVIDESQQYASIGCNIKWKALEEA